jgi:Na+/H+ antiporter NhaC
LELFPLQVRIKCLLLKQAYLGGALALANAFQNWSTNSRRAQIACIILGFCIFFDDYSNVIIVGTTMSAIMSRMKVR